MAWAHLCRRLTLGAWALSQASPHGIYVGESDNVASFLVSNAVFPVSTIVSVIYTFLSSATDDTKCQQQTRSLNKTVRLIQLGIAVLCTAVTYLCLPGKLVTGNMCPVRYTTFPRKKFPWTISK